MHRRHWPTAFGLLAALILGWYLLYTELVIRQMRRDAVAHSRIYATVMRGLNDPRDDAAEQTLLDLSAQIQEIGIPIVVTDADGFPTAVANLPFDADPADPASQLRIRDYLEDIAQQNPPTLVPGPGGEQFTVYFGDPPLVRRLRWIPWLQTGALLGLFAAAWWMIQHNQRTERERIWAAMARESAHQMGTPLSSLEGWLEILRLPPEERDALASLPVVAAEMEADLDRLHKVSRRFEWIGRPVRRERVEVAKLLRTLEQYVWVRLPQLAQGVELKVEPADGVAPVLGNAILLEWALENLVKNALDALAGSGGEIRIAARQRSARRIELRVSDTGPGVAQAVRATLFDPGVTTKKGGWGVGLSLTRRIVEDVHGGRITLAETERGATFVLTLPAAAASEPVEPAVVSTETHV